VKKSILITGGAGFIGANYAARCLSRGEQVIIFDNLSRRGAAMNLAWLQERYGVDAFRFIRGDVRDADHIKAAAKNTERILHLAAQVAVTTSLHDPREDFEVNALGTFNTIEAARASGHKPTFIYTSTNKVYGAMEDLDVVELPTRYKWGSLPLGIGEEQSLDFHSPYGCSKGCGDQYTRDYYRIYGLPTIVMRQSCIYGPRQFGVEDQGWVAWLIIAAVTGKAITIYGDGKQVRDLLFIDDLLDAYDLAFQQPVKAAGEVFNIGGGASNALSIWMEFKPMLESLLGRDIHANRGDWRPGDQPVYISNINKAAKVLGWTPRVSLKDGIERLYNWVSRNPQYFTQSIAGNGSRPSGMVQDGEVKVVEHAAA
jgi:CDP-paratose 2-epimerase